MKMAKNLPSVKWHKTTGRYISRDNATGRFICFGSLKPKDETNSPIPVAQTPPPPLEPPSRTKKK